VLKPLFSPVPKCQILQVAAITDEPPSELREPELAEQSGELDLALDTVKRGRSRDRYWHTRHQWRTGGEQPRLLMRGQHDVDLLFVNHSLGAFEVADGSAPGRGHG
jgi:hypothetical protein